MQAEDKKKNSMIAQLCDYCWNHFDLTNDSTQMIPDQNLLLVCFPNNQK